MIAFEIILRGARQVVGSMKLASGERLPLLRSNMDDMTIIFLTVPCTTMYNHVPFASAP